MRRLRRCGLPADLVERLEKKSFGTAGDVLAVPMVDLIESIGLTLKQAELVVSAAAAAAAPKRTTAQALLHSTPAPSHGCPGGGRFLPTSITTLDMALRGGLLAGTITEVAGPPGAGKTQFCTMMAVQAALPPADGGLGGTVLYIDTEGAFTAERLLEMARERCAESGLLNLVDRVKIVTDPTCAALLQRLRSLEELVIKWNLRLVIVDSIASVIRKEYDSQSSWDRSTLLATEAALLKRAADKFGIAVLVSNQVTTLFDRGAAMSAETDEADEADHPDATAGREGSFVTTALGNSWSHAVNTRLVLEYVEGSHVRLFRIIKSPLVPKATCAVAIEAQGIVSADDSMLAPESIVTINPRIAVRSAPLDASAKLDIHNNIVNYQ